MKQSSTFALVGVSVGIGLGVLAIGQGSDSEGVERDVAAATPSPKSDLQVQPSPRMSNDELKDALLTWFSDNQNGKISYGQLEYISRITESVRGREEEYFSLIRRISDSNGGISLGQLMILANLPLDSPRFGSSSQIPTSYDPPGIQSSVPASVSSPSEYGQISPPDYGNSARARLRNELRTGSGTGYAAEDQQPSAPSLGRAGAINPSTGEFYPAAGHGYVNGRDGTYYAPAGPNAVVDTRTGQIVPVGP